MPRQPTEFKTPIAKWCKRNKVTITQLAEDTGLAYRTAHLSFHGYRVNYKSAERIVKYVKDKAVTIASLCNGKPRSEYQPLTG